MALSLGPSSLCNSGGPGPSNGASPDCCAAEAQSLRFTLQIPSVLFREAMVEDGWHSPSVGHAFPGGEAAARSLLTITHPDLPVPPRTKKNTEARRRSCPMTCCMTCSSRLSRLLSWGVRWEHSGIAGCLWCQCMFDLYCNPC